MLKNILSKLGRNDLCHCGSGKKYKKCCNIAGISISSIDDKWIKIRQTEGELIDKHLLPYVMKNYPKTIIEQALDEFYQDIDLPEETTEHLYKQVFIPWLLFDWIPKSHNLLARKIGLSYLEKMGRKLTDYQKGYLQAICNSYYSFYMVLDVIPEKSITLKDLLLGTEHIIKEKSGTRYLKKNSIIYGRIQFYDEQQVTVGMAPIILPAKMNLELLDFKEAMQSKFKVKKLTPDILRELEDDLRHFCLISIAKLFAPPILHNTDGDLVELCELIYALSLEPIDALERLMPLTFDIEREEILSEAVKDRKGNIKKISLTWAKKGNKLHKSWTNTTLGDIIIEKGKLIVSVNSQKRAQKIQKLIEKYLGDNAQKLKFSVNSIENHLTQSKQSNKAEKKAIAKFNETPEAKAFIEEYIEKHWEDWLNISIPALKGMTPLQAAKTAAGKERLEALFMEFESHSQNTEKIYQPDIKSLRKKLGMSV